MENITVQLYRGKNERDFDIQNLWRNTDGPPTVEITNRFGEMISIEVGEYGGFLIRGFMSGSTESLPIVSILDNSGVGETRIGIKYGN